MVKESESYYYVYFMHSLCLISLSFFIFLMPAKYHILDPIVSLLLIAIILYKNLNIPRDSISLLLLRVNEEVLIREMKETIKDKIEQIYEIDEMRLIPMSSAAFFEGGKCSYDSSSSGSQRALITHARLIHSSNKNHQDKIREDV